MINWMQILLHLRSNYKPLSKVALEVGADAGTLRRIARGDTEEPKYSTGVKLLDLHHDKCPQLHRVDLIAAPFQHEIPVQ